MTIRPVGFRYSKCASRGPASPTKTTLRCLCAATGALLLAAIVPSRSSAATFTDYSGELDAFATASSSSHQSVTIASSPPDNYGSYSASANAQDIGGTASSANATLGADSFSTQISASAVGLFGSPPYTSSSGDITLDFSISDPITVDFLIGGSGRYTASLHPAGSATLLYNLAGTDQSFQGTVPLELQAGTYEWDLRAAPYDPMGGIVRAGNLSVRAAPTPLPAAFWLFGSGVLALGGLLGRKRTGNGAILPNTLDV